MANKKSEMLDVSNLASLYCQAKKLEDPHLQAIAESAMKSAVEAHAELARMEMAEALLAKACTTAP